MDNNLTSQPKNELNFCQSTLQRLDKLINQTRNQADTIEPFLDRFGIEFREKSVSGSPTEDDGDKLSLAAEINLVFYQLESLNDRLDHALNFLNKIA